MYPMFEWDEERPKRINVSKYRRSSQGRLLVVIYVERESKKIHKADGTTVVQQFVLQAGTVMWNPMSKPTFQIQSL